MADVRVELEPRRLTAGTGEPVIVTVTNTGDVIGGYAVRVLGADPAWVRLSDPEPRLFPGESTTVALELRLPPGLPAGERRLAVQVREVTGEQAIAIEELVVDVAGAPRLGVRLEPGTVTGGRRAAYGVVVENTGNTLVDAAIVGTDPEHRLDFHLEPSRLRLAPGEHLTATLTVSGKRRLLGSPVARAFELRADERAQPAPRRRRDAPPGDAARAVTQPDTPPAAMGVFVQRPVLSRASVSLAGLLLAVTVFALVIVTALNTVAARSAADRDLALQVSQAREQVATTGTSSLSGLALLLSSGEPVAGVSVEAFDVTDTSAPVATTASGETGAWAVSSLPAGSYKLRFRGAGFDEVWYPAAATNAEAASVEVGPGESAAGLAVLLGGVPATVGGTVSGDDVAGATATLELPLDSPALLGQLGASEDTGAGRVRGAVVRTVPVGSDGAFELADIPSPAVYDVVVAKPGYSEQVQRVDVAAGEDRTDLQLQLLDGDGAISGRVTGATGPLGGATVTATSGEVTARTVSLTEGEVGSFTLRGLPTPGTFTVIVTAEGHAPATLSLNLGAGQQLDGVAATLGAAAGSLGGTVTAPDGGGGVNVTVTDGSSTRQTVTQSTDPVGSWSVAGLRIPSTYTVTFTRADLASQVVSVSIDGFGNVTAGAPAPDRVDAVMRSATGVLTGTVSQYRDAAAGSAAPAGNVRVTATSGTNEYTVTTASTPADAVGTYVLEDLVPGTYTVTFSRRGTAPTSQIVTVGASQRLRIDPVLVAPASISGRVSLAGEAAEGAVVHLYLASQYGTAAPPVATTTARGGRYAFADVDAPAHYIVELRRSPTGAPLVTSAPVTLGASEAATADLTTP
ncbi:hypothetical protein FE251_06940 [Georgenia wutianyii]|uniref:alpha-amylase n=1 Tax=Georgenia wutianyii TaxID=2585135 RepID=A0ABX5VRE0_9MICO|nr:carboxypeptidase regulatory-like domain-containing protein [Georgenia wutianyii]QDB79135.1 hypothetical protein FE251_06940 [Georgenia wutianyii]